MVKTYRDERMGITSAARVIGCSVSALRDAMHTGEIEDGVPAPQPIQMAGPSRADPRFRIGDVLDTAEALKEVRRRGNA